MKTLKIKQPYSENMTMNLGGSLITFVNGEVIPEHQEKITDEVVFQVSNLIQIFEVVDFDAPAESIRVVAEPKQIVEEEEEEEIVQPFVEESPVLIEDSKEDEAPLEEPAVDESKEEEEEEEVIPVKSVVKSVKSKSKNR
jgi:hypothetical protein